MSIANKRKRIALACSMLAISASAGIARATDLFSVSATTSTGTTVSASGSSAFTLIDNVANSKNQFESLKSSDFTSTLTYGGIKNAITVGQQFDNSGNRVVNFAVPSEGVTHAFNTANGSLDTQIKDYLKTNGLAELSGFQAVVNRSSIAGVVDGNPLAATELIQDAGYQEFGLHVSPVDMDGKQFSSDYGHWTTRVWGQGGVFSSSGINGSFYDITIASEIRFTDIVGLTLTTPLRYERIGTGNVFMGGEVLGIPITVLPAEGGLLRWQITPAVDGAAAGSEDFVSGGLLYGAQINSSFSLSIAGFTATLADQAGYYHGANLDIAGYHFDTSVNQVIFKNGVQLNHSFGPLFLDGSATWTNYLHDAYVKSYFTPEVGIGFKFGRDNGSGLRVGYSGNFGNHYNSSAFNALLYFTF